MLSWKQLAALPPERLAEQDIAAMNCACAVGLHATEWLKPDICLAGLDYYARSVKQFTDWRIDRFHEERHKYQNSEAYFRVLALITCLQRDLGVHYNPYKILEDATFDPRDSFIFGVTAGLGGTCATLPVVYVAVGRRLGYPMKLALAKGPKAFHCFARWEGEERFNIEGTNHGLTCHPDDYYRSGLYATTSEEESECQLLRSMTPADELAMFLKERSLYLDETGRSGEAVDAMGWAAALVPANRRMNWLFDKMRGNWSCRLNRRKPPVFPKLFLRTERRRFPECIPIEDEIEVVALEATQNLLDDPRHIDSFWEPQRRGDQRVTVPISADVDWDGAYSTIRFTQFVEACRRIQ